MAPSADVSNWNGSSRPFALREGKVTAQPESEVLAGRLRGRHALARWSAPGRVHWNTLANLVGRGWTALLAITFTPPIVRLLGIEGYGLVGFFAAMQAAFTVLDLGLSTTLNRELAVLSARTETAQEQRDLVRTLELPYWLFAMAIAALIFAMSPFISGHWVRPAHLSSAAVARAVNMMGLAIALQFPFALYQGGLLGLQRHVLLNTIIVAASTLRFAGVIAVLLWVSPTVETFFKWQVVVSTAQTAAGALLLGRGLPRAQSRARFDKRLLGPVWRFAAGMAGISVTVAVLVQMDRLILSKILNLEDFGYYALASAVAGGLYAIISPLFNALFPRFTQLVATRDESSLSDLYHLGSQVMTVALWPLALVLAFFSREVLTLWTGNSVIASRAGLLVTLLTVGTALNGLMNVPYALQLAHGWTRLTLYGNTVAILILAPAIFVLTKRFGAPGAAMVWLALNAGYLSVNVGLMHRRLLQGKRSQWYLKDVGPPIFAALAASALCRVLAPSGLTGLWMLAVLASSLLVSLVAAAFAAPALRRVLGFAASKGLGIRWRDL